MKILKQGISYKDGIYLECPNCHAEFLVEKREDLEVERSTILSYTKYYKKQVPSYSCSCPCCGYKFYFGVDPNLYSKVTGNSLLSKWQFLFDRDDWHERFEVTDADYVG